MKYLDFEVTIDKKSLWLQEVRKLLKDYHVRWQTIGHCIHVLCMEDAPSYLGISSFLPGRMKYQVAPVIIFDHLEAYKTKGGKFYHIALTASESSPQLSSMIDEIRNNAQEKECVKKKKKRMSVIIGRIPVEEIDFPVLLQLLHDIKVPVIECEISNVKYTDRETAENLGEWSFFETEEKAEAEYKKEYLRHFRNSASNIQLLDPDF